MTGEEMVFTFATTHAAMAGEQALETGGVPARVMAKPDCLGAGCGLCLRVAPADGRRALEKLMAHHAAPEGIYLARRGPEGTEYTRCEP